MKISVRKIAAFVLSILILGQITMTAQTLVSDWGNTPRGTAWPILNTASTPAGNASYGADKRPSAWASIKGGFPTLTISTTQTVVVSGTFEMVGGTANNAYTWLRYALTFQENPVLNNKNTPTAAWTGGNHWGYEFTPRTGVGELANGVGGSGTVWTVNNAAGWNSTFTNNGGPLITVLQAPSRAVATAGVYDWAISVRRLADGTNEIRWYFVKQAAAGKQSDYWFAGIVIDKNPVTDKFNSICFANNNDLDETVKQVNFTKVTAGYGNPLTIPEAPWQAYYVESWGSTPRGSAWPILNTADFVVGNASMGADKRPSGWATIKGGFRETHKPTTKKALIVSGTFEMVGGGANNAYTWLRYALTYQDSAVLNNQNKKDAMWAGKNHWGYEFTPRTGVGELANGVGGSGTVWTVNNAAGWNSTFTNNGGPLITVLQAPSRAVATAGVYDWAISVRPLEDGTNEIRWYFVKKAAAGKQSDYWFAGIVIDKNPVTDKFNGICFGMNNDVDETLKQVNINDVKVDMGNPLTIPEAPWQAYYVDAWGSTPRGSAWPILNTADFVVGNASMGADKRPSGWATIKGGFRETHKPTTKKALIVSGTFEMVGGGANNAYTWLRYALTYQDSAVLNNQNKKDAMWAGKNHWGYEFTPRTGVGELANGVGGSGTVWTVNNAAGWNSTFTNNGGPLVTVFQLPSRAVATAGVYDWAISVRPLEDGTNEIRWYFVKKAAAGKQTDYWFAGIVIDKNPVTDKFNGICFGMNNDVDETLKQVNINDVKVDMGDPLTIPEAPWQAYYVDAWGFVGQRLGGWALTPGDVIGNVTISGSQAPYDFTVLRGAFGESVAPNTKKALIVTGKVEFVGGGFEDWGSLRYGLFNTTNAGKVNTYNVWDGSELNYSGYLFFAPVGRRDPQYWVGQNKYGNIGGIINGIPIYNYGPNDYPISTEYQLPVNAVGRAGIYDFAFSIMPQADGSTEIRHYLIHTNKSYQFSTKVIDKNPVKASDKFNSLVFALGKTSTTKGLKFYDVKVDMGNPITLPIPTSVEQEINSIPTEFSLGQNYPNPFNPTTTIEFALPKKSNVNLIVYDILGGTVASLVNSEMEAGYHKVNFDASNLSSGVYFYSIKAGEFTSVKKLVLMK